MKAIYLAFSVNLVQMGNRYTLYFSDIMNVRLKFMSNIGMISLKLRYKIR